MKYIANKNLRQYIIECESLFVVYRKKEKTYINKLVDTINNESRDITYSEIVNRFGTPKDIIIDYYNQQDIYEVIKKANFSRYLRKLFILLTIGAIIYFFLDAYFLKKSFEGIRNRDHEIGEVFYE